MHTAGNAFIHIVRVESMLNSPNVRNECGFDIGYLFSNSMHLNLIKQETCHVNHT